MLASALQLPLIMQACSSLTTGFAAEGLGKRCLLLWMIQTAEVPHNILSPTMSSHHGACCHLVRKKVSAQAVRKDKLLQSQLSIDKRVERLSLPRQFVLDEEYASPIACNIVEETDWADKPFCKLIEVQSQREGLAWSREEADVVCEGFRWLYV